MTVFFHGYNIRRHLYYTTLLVYRRLLFCSTRCLQWPTKCVLYYHTITVAEKTYRYNECQRVYIIRFANDFIRSIKIIVIFDNIHAVEYYYYYYYNRIIIRDCSLSRERTETDLVQKINLTFCFRPHHRSNFNQTWHHTRTINIIFSSAENRSFFTETDTTLRDTSRYFRGWLLVMYTY